MQKDSRAMLFDELYSPDNKAVLHDVLQNFETFFDTQDDAEDGHMYIPSRIHAMDHRNEIRNDLRAFATNPETPLFYGRYIKTIIESNQNIETRDQLIVPFEITRGVYGDARGALISEKDSFEDIHKTEVSEDYDEKWQDLESYFRKIKPQDLLVTEKELSKENLEDFTFFQQKGFRNVLETELGVSFVELTLPEQYQFLNYAKETTNAESKALIEFCNTNGTAGLRSFLSLEHGGKDMGNTLMELGKSLSPQESKMLFAEYGGLVDVTSKLEQELRTVFQSRQESYTHMLSAQVQDALMLRAKDILIGAKMVVEQEGKEKLSIPDVLAAIAGIKTLVGILADLHTQSMFTFEKQMSQQENSFKYKVSDTDGYDYALKLFVRPRAEKNAQARINIELSFDTAHPNQVLQKAFHNEVVSHTQHKTTKGSVLRIGIDREDYGGNEAVSLDIGRAERSDEALTRSGDVLGNLLALASSEGHHTTSPFSKELAQEENFATLATQFGQYLLQRDLEAPSRAHPQSSSK